MGINVVRRSGISRALAGLGMAMIALPLVVLAAYAALAFVAVVVLVAVATIVRHLVTPAAPVARIDSAARIAAIRASVR